MTSDPIQTGKRVRREVMGESYTKASEAARDDFYGPFRDLVDAFCWGTVWSRPELAKPTRSMITLAVLTALGRTRELKGHLKGALNNGVSKAEIREVLMHAAVYAGIPAGASAFATAREVFAEIERQG